MKNVLIVEDDFSYALELEMLFYSLGYTRILITDNYKEAVMLSQSYQFDIIVSDLEINSKEDGFGVIKFYNSKGIPSILLTQYEVHDYYEEIRRLPKATYLVKPINKLTLNSILELLLGDKPKPVDKEKKVLFAKKGRIRERMTVEEIVWIEVDGNYCVFHDKDGKRFAFKISLNKLLSQLPNELFVKTHRNFIINSGYIKKIDTQKRIVITSNNENIPISKAIMSEFIEFVNKQNII